ncbi:MAG: hypothetical protein ACI85K_002048, partial [Hyphomicrobiaceae bacterium]
GLPLVLSNVGAAQEQLRHGSGVIIEPPFESMFALDASNLDAVTRDVDATFVAACAVAMSKAITTATTSAGLPHIAHRNTMAERHLLLMSWLVQRGTVAGIRQSIARAGSAG